MGSSKVFLGPCQSLSLFNLATRQGMFEAFRNLEGANDDLDNAMNEKRKPKQEVKSLKKFLVALCDLVQDQTEDLFSEMPEVEESRDRSKKSEYAIEEMIAKATNTEIEERKEKLRLKAEKQESDSSLKGKRAILCQKLFSRKIELLCLGPWL